MSVDVPLGWRAGTVGDLVREATSRTGQRTKGGSYLGLEHIGQGTGRLSGIGQASDVTSQKSIFRAGDILYGKLRPNLRKVARPQFDGVCSTDIVVFTATERADPDFAFQVLQSEALVAHAVATAAGTKMPRTHSRSITSFETLLPPLDEQRRIAEVLRSVDEAIRSATEVARSARDTFNRLIDTLHEETADNATPLSSFCVQKGLQTGPFGSQLKVADYVESGVPVLMPTDLKPDGIDFDGAKATSSQKAQQLKQHVLQPGDILFSRRGDVEKCGIYLDSDPVAMCGTGCLRARIDKSRADPVLIYFLVQSETCGTWLKQHAVGVTMPNLNTSIIGALPVPNLPMEEQAHWVEALLMTEGVCRANERHIAVLARIKAAVSDDLLSGRVRVPA